MAKYKSRVKRLEEAVSKIQEGQSEIETLADEMRTWQDNMSGTNLETTEKYERVDEAANVLEQGMQDLEGAISTLEDIEFPGMYG